MKRNADSLFADSLLASCAIEHAGYLYATLDEAAPSCSTIADQRVFLPLGSGWELVPDEESILTWVVAPHFWGCGALVMANGKAYVTQGVLTTVKHGDLSPGDLLPSSKNLLMSQRTSGYKPREHPRQHLRVLSRIAVNSEGLGLGVRLWKSRRFTDCVVACKGTEFPCHCAVLTDASPVIDRMLNSTLQESSTKRIEVDDAEPQVVEAMLAFIYTEKVENSHEEFMSLAALADRFCIDSLLLACADPILRSIDPSTIANVIRMYKCFKERPSPYGSVWTKLQTKISRDAALCSAVMSEV